MRMSRLFDKTLRQDPAEAETASHRLLLKAGLIYQVASGVYAYLPLAHRALRKIETIIRQEMDAIGGQELRMPALQPQELWQETGRDAALGEILFRLADRRQRPLVIAPTHEEVITLLVRNHVQSYRDLPLTLYQIQTKFRDELRPRSGLIRVREFDMKDAYTFDADEDGLDTNYRLMLQAYSNIFSRCGLPFLVVEADSGAIGGKESHEFILPTPVGEDTVVSCDTCGYAANAERATSRKPSQEPEPLQPLEEVHTPGIKTIQELADFLGIPHAKTLKAVFYTCDGQVVFVTIRGDLEVNEVKLKNYLSCSELRLATDDEVQAVGLVAGSASPIGLEGVRAVADDSIYLGNNFVVGANKADHHLRNANPSRDFHPTEVIDIALATADHDCPRCGTPLKSTRGIEVGHVFKLGTFYSETLGASYLDREGHQQPIIMGCYGIGVGRLLAAAIEQNHDDKGIIWPIPIAPYQVHLLALNLDDPSVAMEAEDLYHTLSDAGLEVLYDDRPESPGVKFNDADLLGFPVRVLISPRTLRDREAELKRRTDEDAIRVPLTEAVEQVKALLG